MFQEPPIPPEALTDPGTAAPLVESISVMPPPQPPAWATLPSSWPSMQETIEFLDQLNGGFAAALLIAGIIYMMFGWYMFKPLITLNAAVAGGWIGAMVGHSMSPETAMPGACVGGFIAAAVTWPLMRWAVAITGGLFGFILGVLVWRALLLDVSFAPAGGVTGMVFFSMLTFIVFRGSVVMFTSAQGAAMATMGLLGLLIKSKAAGDLILDAVEASPVVLPMLVFVPAVLGMMYQQASLSAVEGSKKK